MREYSPRAPMPMTVGACVSKRGQQPRVVREVVRRGRDFHMRARARICRQQSIDIRHAVVVVMREDDAIVQ